MLLARFIADMYLVGMIAVDVGLVSAQNYPNKPIRVVTAAPGGGNDFAARLIAQGLTANMGQQVIVENRAGASGSLEAETVAKASPDGYTLLLAPARTPAVLLSRLNQEIVRVIRSAEVKERFFNAGVEAVGSSPQQLVVRIKSETARLGKMIKDAGIRAD